MSDNNRNYTVYSITNKQNDMIYIGCHVTDNLFDNYMGSGTNIKSAIREEGLCNFDKKILYNFDNKEDMLNKERELVNEEFIKQENTYNIILGGSSYNTIGTVTVKTHTGNTMKVNLSDERYLSGELVGVNKGLVIVRDINGKTSQVSLDDERYLSGELQSTLKNKVIVKSVDDDKTHIVCIDDERYLSGKLVGVNKGFVVVKNDTGDFSRVSVDDERYLSGELVHSTKGKVSVKNEKGEFLSVSVDDERYLSGELVHVSKNLVVVRNYTGDTFSVNINDERYLSGELVPVSKGFKHSEETRYKMSLSKKGKSMGEENHSYGKKRIYNKDGVNKLVSEDDLLKYLNDGWLRGMKQSTPPRIGDLSSNFGKQWIYNIELRKTKIVSSEYINDYLDDGWLMGRKMKF